MLKLSELLVVWNFCSTFALSFRCEGHGGKRKPFGAVFEIIAYCSLMQAQKCLCRCMFNKNAHNVLLASFACLHKLLKL